MPPSPPPPPPPSYVDFPPALAVDDDRPRDVTAGTCVTNGNTMLFSCTGTQHSTDLQKLVFLVTLEGATKLRKLCRSALL